jgi:O-antigen ligase
MTTSPQQLAEKPRFAPAFGLTLLLAFALAAVILLQGEWALYGLIGLLGFILFLRWPVLGLYVTTALLLLSASATVVGTLRVHVPVTAAKLAGIAAFTAWAMRAGVLREPVRFTGAGLVLILFFLWSGVGIIMGGDWRLQWPEWIRLGTLLAYLLLAVNVLRSRAEIHRFVMLILLCGLAMSIFALMQYFIPALQLEVTQAAGDIGVRGEGAYVDYGDVEGGPAVRVSGGTGHSNWLAMLLLIIMPLNVYWFMTAKSTALKLLALVTVVLEIAALVLTFTRTGFLIGIIILGVLALRNLVRFTPRRTIFLLLAIFMGWFILPEAYKDRVLDLQTWTQGRSVINRVELQEAAYDYWLQSPVWGVGLGGYGFLLIEDNREISQTMRWFVNRHDWPPQFIGAHNLYLQILSETGAIGFLLMALFFVLLVRKLAEARKDAAYAEDREAEALVSTLQVSLIAFLVSGIFLHALTQKIWWMVCAIALVTPLMSLTEQEAEEKRLSESDL